MTIAVRNLLLGGGLHHPADAAVPSIRRVLQQQGIDSDFEEDVERACERLGQGGYHLLTVCALRWRMLDPRHAPYRERWALALSERARNAIRSHLRAGGALLAMHAATICFDDWPEWGAIVGARWIWGESGHPPYGPAQVRFRHQPTGSITSGLPDFECQDEVYQRMWIADGVQPLADARCMGGNAGEPGNWTPVLWTREWHGGRVVYDALGHDAASLDHPVHQQLLARAARWLTGGETP